MSKDLAPRPDGATASGRRVPRWMQVVLVVSLALNLAVAGVMGGMWARLGPGGTVPPDSLIALARALPPDHRAELRRNLRQGMAEARAERLAAPLWPEMVEVLSAEPLDLPRFSALLEVQRNHLLHQGEITHEALIAQVARMTQAERAAFVAALERMSAGGHRHHRN